jgi:hypothetical protein
MSEKTKSSVYLEQKCEALEQVIDFFSAMQGNAIRSANDKLLIFLAQMDFWDWEMENLIYSFTNFKERSKAWSSNPEIAEQLLKQGILIKNKLERDLGYSMGYNFTRKNNVVAPWNVLKRVILKWNDLLKLCEERFWLRRRPVTVRSISVRTFCPT